MAKAVSVGYIATPGASSARNIPAIRIDCDKRRARTRSLGSDIAHAAEAASASVNGSGGIDGSRAVTIVTPASAPAIHANAATEGKRRRGKRQRRLGERMRAAAVQMTAA